MTISSEAEAFSITIPAAEGVNLRVVPAEEDGAKIYDFVDRSGVSHTSVSLVEDRRSFIKPELHVHAPEEDLASPEGKIVVQQCARVALGMMAIDTGGKIFGGIIYDDELSDLGANEIFPGAHQDPENHFISQKSVRSAIPEGFLGDRV